MSQVQEAGDLEEKRAAESSASSSKKSNYTASVEDISRPHTAKVEEGYSNEVSASTPDYPEGGLEAWKTVLGAWIIQICAFGYTTSFGVYQDYYERVYLKNESASTISWIGSLESFIVVAGGVFAGALYDRGYFYHILIGGSTLLAFSLFMLSLAQPNAYYQIMLSQGIGTGIGAGLLYVPSIAVISQYFHKRRSLAMSIVASGSSFGALCHPLMLNNLLNSHGFAVATRANAGLITGLLLIACLLMRTRITPSKNSVNMWHAMRRFAKDGPYVFASLGMTVFIMGYYFPMFYLQVDAIRHGLDKTFSFYTLVILNASAVVGRITPGLIANKVGVANIVVVATFITVGLIFTVIGLHTVAGFVVFSILFGFFSGVYITMLGPLLALLTDDLSELGARMGIAFCLVGIGSLIGTPIDGALLGDDFQWWKPTLFSGLMAFLGWICFMTSMILFRRKHRATA